MDAWLRFEDACRGNAEHARQPHAQRKNSLYRLLELLRVAPDEVSVRLRALWLGALRGAPGVLLPRRARIRVGAHAVGLGPENRNGGVERARRRCTEREVAPWEAGSF